MSNGNSGDGKPPYRTPPPLPGVPPPPRSHGFDDVRPSDQRTAPPRPGAAQGHQSGGRPAGYPPPPPRSAHASTDARYTRAEAATPPHRPPPGAPPRYAHPHRGIPRPPPRRRSSFLSIVAFVLIGIAVLAGLGVAFALIAPPTDLIRQEAIAAVKRQTGRDLVIRGPARITLYPTIGVSLADVTLSPPPGMSAPPTATMKRIDVALELIPLLSRHVEVKRLVLTRPTFDLRIDRDGRASWDMAAGTSSQPHVRFAEASSAPTSAVVLSDARTPAQGFVLAGAAQRAGGDGHTGAPLASLKGLKLDDVRVVDGAVDYTDERSGAQQRFTSIDAGFAAPNVTSALSAKGDLDWKGETVAFDGSVSTIASLLQEKRAKINVEVKSRTLEAKYAGGLDVASGAVLDGTVALKSPSARALAAWLGSTLPAGDGFGPLSVDGRLKTSPGLVTFDNAEVSLDSMQARGNIAAATDGARPHVKADLKIAELDLNAYIGTRGADGATPAKRAHRDAPDAAPRAQEPARETRQPASIEDLLQQPPGPRVKGYTARSGWSDEPFDVGLLALVDADAKLSVGRLFFRDVKIGQSDVTLALKGRVAKATFERVQLYDGSGRGIITIDASGATPALGANVVVDGVAAAGLLKDAASVEWLSGDGRVTAALTGAGATQRQLVQSLNGRVETLFSNGAINGFNIAKVVRGLGQGRLTGLSSTPSEKTDFSELSATFDVADGVAKNEDLKLLSPLLRVGGSGQIQLIERQLDYTVRPKIVSDTSGQGGAIDLAGLEVPVRITGPWSDPKFTPDLSKVDVGQATKAIEQIGKSLKGKDANEIVDNLFGKDSKEGEKAKKLIDKWFR